MQSNQTGNRWHCAALQPDDECRISKMIGKLKHLKSQEISFLSSSSRSGSSNSKHSPIETPRSLVFESVWSLDRPASPRNKWKSARPSRRSPVSPREPRKDSKRLDEEFNDRILSKLESIECLTRAREKGDETTSPLTTEIKAQASISRGKFIFFAEYEDLPAVTPFSECAKFESEEERRERGANE